MVKKLVRFDWAMKKMLRHKANFHILEGFLSELLGEEVLIKQILESEGNKEEEDDKFNRVDILVENQKGELVIIEVHNTQEYDYFHRMLFGASKAITEHRKEIWDKGKITFITAQQYLRAYTRVIFWGFLTGKSRRTTKQGCMKFTQNFG
jgi:hypothetical protein